MVERWKKTECEIYQRSIIIEAFTKLKCHKNEVRLHDKHGLLVVKNPCKHDDGFEYTENFDGVQVYQDKLYFYNLKMVCDRGGAQTRSLKLVYSFIKEQLTFLEHNPSIKIYFINILDGDESFRCMKKFNHLLEKHSSVKNNIFCGDLITFCTMFSKTFKNEI